MIKRRVLFDINGFLNDLDSCFFNERFDLIDDTVQRYKDFLRESTESIQEQTKKYIMTQHLVIDNEDIRSYVEACHRLNFEK